jgi:hypothetical protein
VHGPPHPKNLYEFAHLNVAATPRFPLVMLEMWQVEMMMVKEERSSSGGSALVRHIPVMHKIVTALRTAINGTAG